MIPDQIGVYSPDDAREIKKRVLGSRKYVSQGNPLGQQAEPDSYYAIAQEDFVPATNPLTGYTTVRVQVLKYGGTTLDMVEVTGVANELVAVIRSRFVYGSTGTLLIIKKIGVEWGVIWVDCPEFTSSSGSGSVTPDPGSDLPSEEPPPPP